MASTETTYSIGALTDMIRAVLQKHSEEIDKMPGLGKVSFEVDFSDLEEVHPTLQKTPDRILRAGSEALKAVIRTRNAGYVDANSDAITLRLKNYPLPTTVRTVHHGMLGKFVGIKGMLIRSSAVESLPVYAVYKCRHGHNSIREAGFDFHMDEVFKCDDQSCKEMKFRLEPALSKFVNYQLLQIQELQEDLPAGHIPKGMGVIVTGDMIDKVRLGDSVLISGILWPEMASKVSLGGDTKSYRYRLYANCIESQSSDGDDAAAVTDEEKTRITNMITKLSEERITEKLIGSVAPHVFGHDLIKEALLLTMIGGDTRVLPDGTKIRGDINMFMLGDPGTAKSKLGQTVHHMHPRSFYASGNASSGVGLTVTVVKDPTTQAYMLQPGIVVLADRGLAVIDEFDKIDPKDTSALHEAMEQQSISLAKGGITATMNARTSILAIANPAFGTYDPFKNFRENVPKIPVPLLTRFDLIFVVRDIPNRKTDSDVAAHVWGVHSGRKNVMPYLDRETFVKYLTMCKAIHPDLTDEAEKKAREYYVDARAREESGFGITVRQFEAVIRLSTARAKMMLRPTVTAEDVEKSVGILKKMMENSAMDVETGQVDLGTITTGVTKSAKGKMDIVIAIVKAMDTEPAILQDMVISGKWSDTTDAQRFLQKMARESIIYEFSPGKWKPVS